MKNPPEPQAFMSYAHPDDELFGGRISTLKNRLEQAYLGANGKRLKIFQDKDAISWGAQWRERIDEALAESLFLIPIITPCFIESPECRHEFMDFVALAQRQLRKDTILPLLFLETWHLDDPALGQTDGIVIELRKIQWRDWRAHAFVDPSDPQMLPHLLEITREIGKAVRSPSVLAVLAGNAASPSSEEPVEVILSLGASARIALKGIGIGSSDDIAVEIIGEASRLAPEPGFKSKPSWSRVFCGALAVGASLPQTTPGGILTYAFARVMKTPKWKKIREENLARFHYEEIGRSLNRLNEGFSNSTNIALKSAYRRFELYGKLTGDSIVRALLYPESTYNQILLYRWIPINTSRHLNINELRKDVEDIAAQLQT